MVYVLDRVLNKMASRKSIELIQYLSGGIPFRVALVSPCSNASC